MTGGYFQQYLIRASKFTDAVEEARKQHAIKSEEKLLRRARIQNGKDPVYKNGHPKSKEKRG